MIAFLTHNKRFCREELEREYTFRYHDNKGRCLLLNGQLYDYRIVSEEKELQGLELDNYVVIGRVDHSLIRVARGRMKA